MLIFSMLTNHAFPVCNKKYDALSILHAFSIND